MRHQLACATAVTVLLIGDAAFPCGASFGTNITVDSHQDIIIAWKNGVETYVFQPTFCGTSGTFGLILPVPALLSSEPSLFDQQAFTTAVALSEPAKRQVKEGSGGIGCGSASSLKGASTDNGTAVVASGRVGFLDWVELKADSPSTFTTWLTSNGYPFSTAASDTFSYYVTKGWYFLAFRISQNAVPDGGTVCQALGPVAVSFPASGPVVPSRMAGASSKAGGASYSGSMYWRIFGITSSDSEISFPNVSDQYGGLWYSGTIQAADAPSFAGLAVAGDRLTRLILTFYPGSSDADATLTLATPKDYRGTEDVVVSDDSLCSVSPSRRWPHSAALSLFGLAVIGLVCWRRIR